jgi:hypothetical protein
MTTTTCTAEHRHTGTAAAAAALYSACRSSTQLDCCVRVWVCAEVCLLGRWEGGVC